MKKHKLHITHTREIGSRGFTIVELLIVIVVIAILAAISTLAFNGVRERALQSSVKTSLGDTVRRIEVDKATRGAYASSLTELQNSSSSSTSNVAYQYTGGGESYCLTATLQKYSYHTCSGYGEPREGVYAEHTDPNASDTSTQIAHTQTGSFEFKPDAPGGSAISIPVNYNLQPDDFVFILFNANYRAQISLTGPNSTALTKVHEQSMEAAGYQKNIVYTGTGFSGNVTFNGNVCWFNCTNTGSATTGAAYIVYVIRGIDTPTIAATSAGYSTAAGADNIISPAAQTVNKGEIAIFTYVSYMVQIPPVTNLSSPAGSWTTAVQRTGTTTLYGVNGLTSLHIIADSPLQARYQVTVPASGARFAGATMYTIK